MASAEALRVLLVSSASPRITLRLAQRVVGECKGVCLCSILDVEPTESETQSANLLSAPDPVGSRSKLALIADFFVRVFHACPASVNGRAQVLPEDLERFAQSISCLYLKAQAKDTSGPAALFEESRPDIGILYGPETPPVGLPNPRLGWLAIRAECLKWADNEIRLGVTLERVEGSGEMVICDESFPVEQFDGLTSLSLKATLLSSDLLVRMLKVFAEGRAPAGVQLRQGGEPLNKGGLALLKSQFPIGPRGRTWVKLARTLIWGPYIMARNWYRRLTGTFPVLILFHHVITDRPHPLGISTALFLKHVEFLKRNYRVVSLSEGIKLLQSQRLKAPTAVLTFDDGYSDNYLNLRAVAEATGIVGALFVCTDHVSRQVEFGHDIRKNVHGFLPFTWEQILELNRGGFDIGSHTRTHFDCGSTEWDALRREIVESRREIEERLGRPVRLFSFPWGQPKNMSKVAIRLAEESYDHTFSAYGGANFIGRSDHLHHLSRVSHPNDLWTLELILQEIIH